MTPDRRFGLDRQGWTATAAAPAIDAGDQNPPDGAIAPTRRP